MTPGLKRGDTGEDVRSLQAWLSLHYGARLRADGHYGALTQGTIRRFQAAHGLEPSGVLTEATLAIILREDATHVRRATQDPGAVLPPALGGMVPEEEPC